MKELKLFSSDVKKFVTGLKSEEGKDILLSGGSVLATNLLTENLINEIQLRVHPVMMGSGIPLFYEHDDVSLRLVLQKNIRTTSF